MTDSTHKPYPFVAMLAYEDAPAAIDFLCTAFGFEQQFRLDMPDGSVGHAELALPGTDGHFTLATTWKDAGMANPQTLGGVHSQIQCNISDVDSHYARARDAGATVVAPPEDQVYGSRIYRAVDPEGHRWVFSEHLREVTLKEMKAKMNGED